jgi:hypothetical protein
MIDDVRRGKISVASKPIQLVYKLIQSINR